jgi:MoxR-like ATPase
MRSETHCTNATTEQHHKPRGDQPRRPVSVHYEEIDMQQQYDGARLFGLPSPSSIIGYSGVTSTYLGQPTKSYSFDAADAVQLLAAAWHREMTRPDNATRKGVFLYGPTGSGKTTMFQEFFWRIGVPMLLVTWSPRMEAMDLVSAKTVIGGDVLTNDQAIVIAARQGFPIVLDELDLADPAELTSINEIIEKGVVTLPDGERIVAKRGFFVCATGNTNGGEDETGSYIGTRAQNIAPMRRFFHAEVAYPSLSQERDFLRSANKSLGLGLPQLVADNVADFIQATRNAFTGTKDGKRLGAAMSRTEGVDFLTLMASPHVHHKKDGRSKADVVMQWVFGNRLSRPDRVVAGEILKAGWRSVIEQPDQTTQATA